MSKSAAADRLRACRAERVRRRCYALASCSVALLDGSVKKQAACLASFEPSIGQAELRMRPKGDRTLLAVRLAIAKRQHLDRMGRITKYGPWLAISVRRSAWRSGIVKTTDFTNPHANTVDGESITVMEACDAYVAKIRALKGDKAADDLEDRYRRYLDRDQRRRFIDLAEPDLAQFIRALCFLPLRPGALASLLVADFDQQFEILRIGRDKSGAERKFKVPADIADFFRRSAGERCANEPLVARANGLAWNKDAWKDPLKSAANKAGLPAETVAYSLRHSVISDLVHGGLDLLTVAQISGTSVAMIEKHYAHLRGDVAAVALSKLVL